MISQYCRSIDMKSNSLFKRLSLFWSRLESFGAKLLLFNQFIENLILIRVKLAMVIITTSYCHSASPDTLLELWQWVIPFEGLCLRVFNSIIIDWLSLNTRGESVFYWEIQDFVLPCLCISGGLRSLHRLGNIYIYI